MTAQCNSSPVTESDPDEVIAWHADLRALQDYRRAARVSTMTTTIAKPVVLPAELQKTLNHRIEWNRSARR